MKNWIPALVLSALSGCAASSPPHAQHPLPVLGPATPIAWQSWSPEVFARAKRENKLVLVDVGIEGCTACRWMHEGTYRDPEVQRRVSASFVPVAVDADTQPDLGERYEAWGWPATIFLNGDGERVLALRGSREAGVFTNVIDRLVEHKDAGALAKAAAPEPEAAGPGDLETMCREAQGRLEALGDDTGWGGGERIAHAPPVLDAFLRAHAHGESRLQTRALAALAGETKLLDPVWGGVYVASTSTDWDSPIVEKRTVQEAHALAGFAEGYHATRDARWLTAAKAVHKYLHDWMLAPDGTFYSTQHDDAPNLPSNLTANDYYALGDTERRKYGIPPIDHGVYTDQNGLTIVAYAGLYEATGDREMLDIATHAATTLLESRQRPDGTMIQFRESQAVRADERLRPILSDEGVFLNAQSEFGLALVALARVTGDVRWVDAAERLARGTRAALEDTTRGGFFSSGARPTDAMFARRKPFYDNVEVARFLLQLSWVTKDASWRQVAERTVRAVATPSALADEGAWGIAPYTLLEDELAIDPIRITIVTSKKDPRADALFASALRLYEPRKVVRFEAPGTTYPDKGQPALHVCTTSACSSPVVDPAGVETAAAPFLAEKTSACAGAPR